VLRHSDQLQPVALDFSPIYGLPDTSLTVEKGDVRVNFVVIDVETANPDLSSICQVGVASFRDGGLHNSWESLVNPEDEFDPICVSIHGIDAEKVRASPSWAAVYSEVSALLDGNIVACHTAFDRVALLRACEKNNLEHCECRWLDSAMVVRRAWPIFSRSGYGLANVAAQFDIKYRPHNALDLRMLAVRARSCCGQSLKLVWASINGLNV
jgi:DNA polymerase-3 subunit epsilon